MKVLQNLGEVHLFETESNEITYEKRTLTEGEIANLKDMYHVITPGFVLMFSNGTLAVTTNGEHVVFCKSREQILMAEEIYGRAQYCPAHLFSGKKKTAR